MVYYHARARVGIHVINFATRHATKMKAKFSYCYQIKFNEPVSVKTSARYTNVLLTGEVTVKNVTGSVKVFKNDE